MSSQHAASKGGEVLKLWTRALIITVLFAVPTMALGQVIWPPAPGPEPTAGQLPFFIFLAATEAVTFGLGVSFLIFGLPLIRKFAGGSKPVRAWAMYLSLGWLLVSWWPHDNLHTHNGMDMQRLLYIEYGFHVTLMGAGLVLAYSFLSLIHESSERAATRETSGEISAQRAEAL